MIKSRGPTEERGTAIAIGRAKGGAGNTVWRGQCALLLGLTLLGGCLSPRSRSAVQLLEPIEGGEGVFVCCGHLETFWVEDQLGVAVYGLKTARSERGARVLLQVVAYKETLPTAIPTDALLAMTRRKDGGLELVGRDASASLAEDTPQNRKAWEEAFSRGKFFPPRRRWISKSAAVAQAKAALSIAEGTEGAFVFTPRRYEFGWRVWVKPADAEASIGAQAEVGIGDDGRLKFLLRY